MISIARHTDLACSAQVAPQRAFLRTRFMAPWHGVATPSHSGNLDIYLGSCVGATDSYMPRYWCPGGQVGHVRPASPAQVGNRPYL